MDVLIRFDDGADPPAGVIVAGDHEPVTFRGRLALVRALDEAVQATPGVVDGSAGGPAGGEGGGQLDAAAHPELGEHVGHVAGDGVPGDDELGGDLGVGESAAGQLGDAQLAGGERLPPADRA